MESKIELDISLNSLIGTVSRELVTEFAIRISTIDRGESKRLIELVEYWNNEIDIINARRSQEEDLVEFGQELP